MKKSKVAKEPDAGWYEYAMGTIPAVYGMIERTILGELDRHRQGERSYEQGYSDGIAWAAHHEKEAQEWAETAEAYRARRA